MRALNLSKLNLRAESLLQREQLKSVFGGYLDDYSTCSAKCDDNGNSVSCTGTYSCTATDYVGCNGDDGTDEKSCYLV